MGDRVSDIAIAIVGVAMVTTLVAHKNTAKVVTSIGNAFSHSIKAATGQ